MSDEVQTYTPADLDNQPAPCLAGGGISCGIWVYCDKPRNHPDRQHAGWSCEVDGTAARAIWEDPAERCLVTAVDQRGNLLTCDRPPHDDTSEHEQHNASGVVALTWRTSTREEG